MSRSVLFRIVSLAALMLPSAVFAGRLDIAVIQFSDARPAELIAQGLANTDLLKITDSDSTETRDPGLISGRVIFVQSFYIQPGSKFGTSTRLSNQRADVSGSLSGTNLTTEIFLQDGVDVGLRKYTTRTFSASGSVAGGQAVIVSLRQTTGKTQNVIKGKATIVSTEFTTLIAAQYTP